LAISESDFIMRDAGTNTLDYFGVANSQIVAARPMGNIGAEWQPLGFGDFSGNAGETDMLMRDSGNNNIDFYNTRRYDRRR